MNEEEKKLVEEHEKVLYWIMKKHFQSIPLGCDFYNDMIQEGQLAMCEAAMKYDENIANFLTYSYKYCYGKILTHYNRYLPGVLSSKRSGNQYDKCELSSLDVVVDEETGMTLLDILKCEEKDYENQELIDPFVEAFKYASKKHGIDVLRLKIMGYNNTEIGNMLGVTKSRISAIVKKAHIKYMENSVFAK